MLIRVPVRHEPQPSEITPRRIWSQRRDLMRAAGAGIAFPLLSGPAAAQSGKPALKLAAAPGPFGTTDKPTSYRDVTTYNNFYEFGLEKDEPARRAGSLKVRPWSVAVEGAVAKPASFTIEDLLKLSPMQERTYRMRCVEGWSMVIPWIGFSLSELIRKVEPTGNAKFVEFVTLSDSGQMPGLRSSVIDWPYREGLRMDEANHPLTLLAFGLYGEVLPNQNGAPIRLVVPWKYGFKSSK